MHTEPCDHSGLHKSFRKLQFRIVALICLSWAYNTVPLNVIELCVGNPHITMQALMNLKAMYTAIVT